MSSVAHSPTQKQVLAAEEQKPPSKQYYLTPRRLRIELSEPWVGINTIKLVHFIDDETLGWDSSRWAALSQRDILNGVPWHSGNGSGVSTPAAVTRAIKQALELRLIEVQCDGGTTLYAIHRRFWIDANLIPRWYTYRVPYNAEREPPLEEQAVITRIASSYHQDSEQLSPGQQAVITTTTATAAEARPEEAPRAPNKASQESSFNKDVQEIIARSPNGSRSHVFEKGEREDTGTKGRKDDLKGGEGSLSPAASPPPNVVRAYRQSEADTEQRTIRQASTEEAEAIPVPSKVGASVTARERTDAPEAVIQAASKMTQAATKAESDLGRLRKRRQEVITKLEQLKAKEPELRKQLEAAFLQGEEAYNAVLVVLHKNENAQGRNHLKLQRLETKIKWCQRAAELAAAQKEAVYTDSSPKESLDQEANAAPVHKESSGNSEPPQTNRAKSEEMEATAPSLQPEVNEHPEDFQADTQTVEELERSREAVQAKLDGLVQGEKELQKEFRVPQGRRLSAVMKDLSRNRDVQEDLRQELETLEYQIARLQCERQPALVS